MTRAPFDGRRCVRREWRLVTGPEFIAVRPEGAVLAEGRAHTPIPTANRIRRGSPLRSDQIVSMTTVAM
jgi:hypothetical protein